MQGRRDIDLGVRSHDHPSRIDEKDIGLAHSGTQGTVDVGGRAARDPADDVLNLVGTGEGGALPGRNVETLEAVEEIGPARGA